jgi:hypothetical protein
MRFLFGVWLAVGVAGFESRAAANDIYLDCDLEETPTQGARSPYQELIKLRLAMDSAKAQDNWGNTYHLRTDERKVELISEPARDIKLVYEFRIDLVDGIISGSVRYRGDRDAILRVTGTCARVLPPKLAG